MRAVTPASSEKQTFIHSAILVCYGCSQHSEKMDELKKGKSLVVEFGHTLLLGWTDKTIQCIEEICLASASEGGTTIVLMAEEEKEKLESTFEGLFNENKLFGTKVIFRTGSPFVPNDLYRVAAQNAKSTVVFSSAGDPDLADSETLRVVLALSALATSYSDVFHGFVVAEVRDIDNEPLIKISGRSLIETVVSHDVLGRLMVMSARQIGLAKVYSEVFGFEGEEFYMKNWPQLDGVPFGSLVDRFPSAIPIGVRLTTGKVVLNPPLERPVGVGEELIVIAADDDTYCPEEPTTFDIVEPPQLENKGAVRGEKILCCNQRRDIDDILVSADSRYSRRSSLICSFLVLPSPRPHRFT